MFARVAVVLAALATVSVAIPTAHSACNSGPAQCCNQVQPASSKSAGDALGLLSIVIQDLSIPVGVSCSPVNVLGAGGPSCNQQTVCCENNSFNGLVALGCTPINLGI
ncbi:fungal hydrophobin [Vararia minispora EC-137]|uniref:Fungal hydrophobin n=1 Tax=Vararia minispora EC-137 TaxID=1314806 RepID=A0ACB8QNP5_9AGAM|nr:fungal hydrophobin [Vararia minispora EC-137]